MTDPERAQRALPFLDLSQLKFRERDDLEAIFKAWRRADDKAFDVRRLWDERMRLYLKTRYDARANVADWDYNMRLFVHAPMVHPKHYEHWRETGVAFDPRDAPYDHVNRTLASEAPAREQGRKARRCNAYVSAGFHNNPAPPTGAEARLLGRHQHGAVHCLWHTLGGPGHAGQAKRTAHQGIRICVACAGLGTAHAVHTPPLDLAPVL